MPVCSGGAPFRRIQIVIIHPLVVPTTRISNNNWICNHVQQKNLKSWPRHRVAFAHTGRAAPPTSNEAMRASGKYSSIEMSKGGGYVAIEKSTARHMPEELEAARILADKGYKVILKDEATGLHGVKTPDGYLFNASFEQRTPTKDGANTIRNALFHARDIKADAALIYSKGHTFSKESTEKDIRLFEDASPYRFKNIIIVSDNGHIHRYRHNK